MKGVLRVLRRPATGALTGQVSQAGAALVLQVVAARSLGAAGLATFSLLYGALVLATAVCSGLVGDTLTVLDRHDPRIRAGLYTGAALVSGVTGAGAVTLSVLLGLLSPGDSLLLGLAAAAFVIEDTLRRLLMATGRFWWLPVVDLTVLLGSLAMIVATGLVGRTDLGHLVAALLVGQVGAAAVAWLLLPRHERPLGPWRSPALAAVAGFGVWRAAAQAIRPTLLTLLRVAVVGLAGAAAYGPVEAARVYTAPTLLLVAGLGSFLLPHFVALRDRGAAVGLRRADRAAAGTALAVASVGLLAVVALPLAGPLVTGGGYAVPLGAVVGWSVYAVASAVLLPYASLASVHHRQRRVLALRALELTSVALVALLLAIGRPSVTWAPAALAAGPLLTAVAVRWTVLRPMARRVPPAPVPSVATSPA